MNATPFIIIDVILFVIFVIFLARLCWTQRKHIAIQKLVAIGKVPIIFLAMLRTTWGLDLMDRWAKKYGKFIRFMGYTSIGIAIVAMFVGLYLMGLVAYKLFTDPIQASIAPALPFTNLPVIGYLSFTYWIIIIAYIATIHEFAHGVVARAFGIRVKKSGIAILNLFLPIIPAAFVEPDEKQLRKNEPAFYATIAAGPASNIISAFLVWLLLLFVLVPIDNSLTSPVGFSLDPNNQTAPAALAGFDNDLIITTIDGVSTNNASNFISQSLAVYEPDMSLVLEGYNDTSKEAFTKVLSPVEHPQKPGVAYIGAFVANEIRYDNEGVGTTIFAWIMQLFRLMFMFNLFVGILNMLPIAIADGGQIFGFLLDNGKKGNWGQKLTLTLTLIILAIILAGMGSWIYHSAIGAFG